MVSVEVSELPFDIIIEILSWLPVESLLRFKCVCKRWCSLILDYKFIAKHMGRASHLRLMYQYNWAPNNLVAILDDEHFVFMSICAGLILEKSIVDSSVLRIRNPATHQVLYLPADEHDDTKEVIACVFNSFTGECKVACFCSKRNSFSVITLGKDDQYWRPLKLPNLNYWMEEQQGKYRYICGADNVEGFAHVVDIIRDGEDLSLEVQSFNLWSECFITTTLPRGVFLDLEKVNVFYWKNTIAVADIAEEALNILVLEDVKEHKWSRNKVIIPLKFLKDDALLKNRIRPRRGDSHQLVFINEEEKKVLIYDVERETVNILTQSSKKYTTLKPSLVTLKGMIPHKVYSQELRATSNYG